MTHRANRPARGERFARAAGIVLAACVVGAGGGVSPTRQPAEGGSAPAVEAEFWRFPPGTLAAWACDPGAIPGGPADGAEADESVLDVARAAAILTRALPASPDPVASPELAGLAAALVRCHRPTRAAVLGVGGSMTAAYGRWTTTRLSAVIEVRDADSPAIDRAGPEFEAACRAMTGRVFEPFDAGTGWRAAVSRSSGWDELAWAVSHDRFCLTVGPGSLAAWLKEAPGAEPEPDGLRDHAAAAGRAVGAGVEAGQGLRPFLLVGADLDALRRAVPEAFALGRTGRVLAAWRLANARGAAAGAWVDGAELAGISVGAAWSSRADPAGTIRSAGFGGPANGGAERGTGATITITPDWLGLVGGAVATRRAWVEPAPVRRGQASAVEAAFLAWARRGMAPLLRVIELSGGQAELRCTGPAWFRDATAWVRLTGRGAVSERAVLGGLLETLDEPQGRPPQEGRWTIPLGSRVGGWPVAVGISATGDRPVEVVIQWRW